MAAMLECTEGKLAGVRSIHYEHAEGEAGPSPVIPIKLKDNDAEVYMDADSEGTVAVVYDDSMLHDSKLMSCLPSRYKKESPTVHVESEMNAFTTMDHIFTETPSKERVFVLIDSKTVYDALAAKLRNEGHVPFFLGGGTTPFTQANDTNVHGAIKARLRDMEIYDKAQRHTVSQKTGLKVLFEAWGSYRTPHDPGTSM